VEWRKESGKFSMKTDIPEGIEAEVVLDRDPAKPQTLRHNQAQFTLQRLEKSPGGGIEVEMSTFMSRHGRPCRPGREIHMQGFFRHWSITSFTSPVLKAIRKTRTTVT